MCCRVPYVLKPVSEGSSFGVFIVKEDQEHPPQELTARRTGRMAT